MDELVRQILPYRETFLLVLCRLTAMFVVAPILGHRALPVQHKVAIAILIAMVVTPALGPAQHRGVSVGAVAGEVLVGLVIGFIASLVVGAIEVAGELLGVQMGLGVAGLYDPAFGQQVTPVTRFYDVAALAMILVTNAHHLLIRAAAASFRPIQPGTVAMHGAVGAAVAMLGGKLLRSGLELAAPLAGLLFVVKVAIALLARVAPQMNLFTVGMPVAIAVGLFGLVETLPHVFGVFERLLDELATDLVAVLGG